MGVGCFTVFQAWTLLNTRLEAIASNKRTLQTGLLALQRTEQEAPIGWRPSLLGWRNRSSHLSHDDPRFIAGSANRCRRPISCRAWLSPIGAPIEAPPHPVGSRKLARLSLVGSGPWHGLRSAVHFFLFCSFSDNCPFFRLSPAIPFCGITLRIEMGCSAPHDAAPSAHSTSDDLAYRDTSHHLDP